jgi:acyl-CoA synthetase (AMP-forming)/AMP-acid ligase II
MCLTIVAARSCCLIATRMQHVVTKFHLIARRGHCIMSHELQTQGTLSGHRSRTCRGLVQPNDEIRMCSSACSSIVCAMLGLSVLLLSAGAQLVLLKTSLPNNGQQVVKTTLDEHEVQLANVFSATNGSSLSNSDMGDELTTLADKIKKTEEELLEVKADIKAIRTGDDAAVKALDFGSRDEGLKHLRAKEIALQNEKVELQKKENLLIEQQQSGAGTSMVPVRQGAVMFPCQRSCCIH